MIQDTRHERTHPLPQRQAHPLIPPVTIPWRGRNGDIPVGGLSDTGLHTCLRAIQSRIPDADQRPRIWDALVVEAIRRGYGWVEWIDPLNPVNPYTD